MTGAGDRGPAPVTHGVARRTAAVLVVLAAALVVAVLVLSGVVGWWVDIITGYWDRLPLP